MPETQLQISYGGYTTAGLKAENQDAFAIYPAKNSELKYKGFCAVIADGVSASARSAEASHVGVNNFINDYYSTPDSWTVKESGARVLNSLNAWLYQHGTQTRAQISELVTTFSAVIFKSNTAHLFHIGDSAIFRLRDGALEKLSRVHTIVQKNSNDILTRALGMDSHLEVDYHQLDVEEGDLLLLSTDGIHDFLSENEIKSLLQETHISLEALCQRLANHALNKGSDDNLSCLACKVEQLPQEHIDEAHRSVTSKAIPPVMRIGNRIDEYTVDQVVHSSTRSHVYLVHGDSDDTPLVLKAPSENFRDDPHFLESFIREQWIGQQLNHPNIMQVFKREHDSRFLYNLYEYIPAQDLRQWMHDNPKPAIGRVRAIIKQVSSGLRAFQRASMVHRDLKPENIMINRDDRVKLIDFGTIYVNGLAEISSPINESAPVGSENYIAPEYLMGQTGQYRSDIFSLGVIAYEMLCGELPYKQNLYTNKIPNNYRLWEYRAIEHARSDIPTWVNGALKKACAANPKDRYPALSEFNQDLAIPNNALAESQQPTLIEKNPVLFWQLTSLALLIALIIQANR